VHGTEARERERSTLYLGTKTEITQKIKNKKTKKKKKEKERMQDTTKKLQPKKVDGTGLKIAIVHSRWNEEIVLRCREFGCFKP
jgi:hypothetical protein